MEDITVKKVIVIGGGELGSRIGSELKTRNIFVIVISRSQRPPDEYQNWTDKYFVCDISDKKSLRKVVDKIENPENIIGVINTAGGLGNSSTEEMTINYHNVIDCTKQLNALGIQNQVIISSVAGFSKDLTCGGRFTHDGYAKAKKKIVQELKTLYPVVCPYFIKNTQIAKVDDVFWAEYMVHTTKTICDLLLKEVKPGIYFTSHQGKLFAFLLKHMNESQATSIDRLLRSILC